MTRLASFRCIDGCVTHALDEPVYACRECGGLLEVVFSEAVTGARSARGWRELFASRPLHRERSGVWRFREWVLPDLAEEEVVTLGEGGSPLVEARRLSDELGVRVRVKQCGQTATGSFKDLGMTVLVSQVASMRRRGHAVPAVACASTGDTSAALAAYGAAAGLRTLVLLPRGMISGAQLVQPLAHGARVLAIDTDFDGCMAHVQRLAEEEGVYLANSKNSLRIEGQKTVAFEIAEALGWRVPDWVAIPGGNLGNVSALGRGFRMLRDAGLTDRLPRLLCAQAEAANPLYRSFAGGLTPLAPVVAGDTAASAIRIGNPVSFDKAVHALRASNGVVESIGEAEIAAATRRADASGLYVCPQTAVALAAVEKQRAAGTLDPGSEVVVIATAHGLKFSEYKASVAGGAIEVGDDFDALRTAALA